MKHFQFKSYLTSNIGANHALTQTLLGQCKTKEVQKKEFLLQPGDKRPHAYFVEVGLLKQYSIDEKGKEHILQFAPENWFLSNRESAYLNQPATYFMEAIEDTTVFVVEKDLIMTLSNDNPSFIEFNNDLLHKHIAGLQKRITQLQSASAKARYLDFIEIYPDLLLRVPQADVASYLGITPESLSRIRRELAEEHRLIS